MNPIFMILNAIGLLFFIAGVTYYEVKYNIEKGRADELERRSTLNITNFERLIEISKLYRDVDFKKLRPDQVEDWDNFVKKYIIKGENKNE